MRTLPTELDCCFVLLCTLILTIGAVAANDQASESATWRLHVISDLGDGHDGTRIADVNGDGLTDVVTGCEESGHVLVCLHPGHDKVHAKWPQVVAGNCRLVEDAVFVDLDADGATDVVASCESNQVIVCWAPKKKEDYLISAKWNQEPIPAAKGGSRVQRRGVHRHKGLLHTLAISGNASVEWI